MLKAGKQIICIVIMALTVLSVSLYADTAPPAVVGLQVVLEGNDGELLHENGRWIEVRLYSGDSATGWQELHKNVNIVNGNCQLKLGEIKPFSPGDFDIRTPNFRLLLDGVELTPVTLNSIPYAIRAIMADNVPEELDLKKLTVTENFIVGNQDLNSLLHVSGNVTVAGELSVSTDVLVVTNNRVGIGTEDPDYKLEVLGPVNVASLFIGGAPFVQAEGFANINDIADLTTENTDFLMADGDKWTTVSALTVRDTIGLGVTGNPEFDHLFIKKLSINTDDFDGLFNIVTTLNVPFTGIVTYNTFIVKSTRIGIGLTEPSASLHVTGSLIVDTATTKNAFVVTGDGNIGIGRIPDSRYALHVKGDVKIEGVISTALGLASDDDWSISLPNIFTSLNIGVNATVPSGDFHVRSVYRNLSGTGDVFVITNNRIGIGDTEPLALLYIKPQDLTEDLLFRVDDNNENPLFVITTSNGAVGVGTSDPEGLFHVRSGMNDTFIVSGNQVAIGTTNITSLLDIYSSSGLSAASYLKISSGNTTLFIVTANGNVGIGTSDPAGLLHIVSDGRDSFLVNKDAVGIGTTDPGALMDLHAAHVLLKDNFFRISLDDDTKFVVKDEGFVGIGIDKPSGILQVGQDMLIVTDNRVGIGTDIPSGDFHFISSGVTGKRTSFIITNNQTVINNAQNGIPLPNDNCALTIYGNVKVNGVFYQDPLYKDGSDSSWDTDWYYDYGQIYNINYMVGIGTSDPAGKLHIVTTENEIAIPALKHTFIVTDNKVAIGTTTPEARLHIKAVDVDVEDVVSERKLVKVDVAGTENIFVIDKYGYIGVGVHKPAFDLDVSGNINVKSIYVNGKILDIANIQATDKSFVVGSKNYSTGEEFWTVKQGYDVRDAMDLSPDDQVNFNKLGINLNTVSDILLGEFHLKSTDNYNAGSKDDLIVASNNEVGIGITDPVARLDVRGTANRDLVFYAQGRGSTNNMAFDFSGHLGIGTSSPEGDLHIYYAKENKHSLVATLNRIGIGTSDPGSSLLTVRYESGSGINRYHDGLWLINENSGVENRSLNRSSIRMTIGVDNIPEQKYKDAKISAGYQDINKAQLIFSFKDRDDASFRDVVWIKNNGSLGINTEAPAGNLHVFTGNKKKDLMVNSTGVAIGTLLPSGNLHVATEVTSNSLVVNRNGIGIGTVTPAASIHVVSEGLDTFIVTNNRAGIGTVNNVSPNELLHISYDSSLVKYDNVQGLMIENLYSQALLNSMEDAPGIVLKMYEAEAKLSAVSKNASTDMVFSFKDEGASDFVERARIQSNGYVGIGTDLPSGNFHVVTEVKRNTLVVKSEGIAIGTIYPSGNFHVATDVTENFLIVTANGIGLGTRNPEGLLHVVSAEGDTLVITNNRVALGTTNPTGDLHIVSNGAYATMLVTNNIVFIKPEADDLVRDEYSLYVVGDVHVAGNLSSEGKADYIDEYLGINIFHPLGPLHIVSTDNYVQDNWFDYDKPTQNTLLVSDNRVLIGGTYVKGNTVAQLSVLQGPIMGQGPVLTWDESPLLPTMAVYLTYATSNLSIYKDKWSGTGVYDNNSIWLRSNNYYFWNYDNAGARTGLITFSSEGELGIGNGVPANTDPQAGVHTFQPHQASLIAGISFSDRTFVVTKNGAVGAVGIGTDTPELDLEVQGGSAVVGIKIDNTSGQAYSLFSTDTDKFILYDETNLMERIVVLPYGETGIGTANPLAALQVSTANEFNTSSVPGRDNIFVFRERDLAVNEFGGSIGFSSAPNTKENSRRASIASVRGNDQDQAGLAFFTHPSTTAADPLVEIMRISPSGNVGIGTTAPEAMLHVTTDSGVVFNAEGTVESNTFVVLANGNVGVGTADPKARMDVYEPAVLGSSSGDDQILAVFRGQVDSGGEKIYRGLWSYRDYGPGSGARLHDAVSTGNSSMDPGDSTMVWWERDPGDDIQSWGNENLLYMTLREGKLGLGTANPSTKLQVDDGNGNTVLAVNSMRQVGIGTYVPSADFHVITDILHDTLVVTSSKVGIGTESPDYELDVVGTLNVTDEIWVNGTRVIGTTLSLKDLSELSTENGSFIVADYDLSLGRDTWVTKDPESVRNIIRLGTSHTVTFNRIGINMHSDTVEGELHVMSTDNAGLERFHTMVINDNRIGVGITDPKAELHVHLPSAADNDVNLLLSGSLKAPSIQFTDTDMATNIRGIYGLARNTNDFISGTVENDMVLGTRGDVDLIMFSNDQERMRISGTGEVVIGTRNSTNSLLAVANAVKSNLFVVRNDGHVGIGVDSTNGLLNVDNTLIVKDKKVGINTGLDNITTKLQVNADTGPQSTGQILIYGNKEPVNGNAYISYFDGTDNGSWWSTGTDSKTNALVISNDTLLGTNKRLVIKQDNLNSYVGIGDSDPTAALSVSANSASIPIPLLKISGSVSTHNVNFHSDGTFGIGTNQSQQDAGLHVKTVDRDIFKLETDVKEFVFIVEEDGHVGIGKDPVEILDIEKDSVADQTTVRVYNTASGGTSHSSFVARSKEGDSILGLNLDSAVNWYVGADRDDGGASTDKFKIGTTNAGLDPVPGSGDILTIRKAGYIGVGITEPEVELHVKGTISANEMIISDQFITSEVRAYNASGLKLADQHGSLGLFVKEGGMVGAGTTEPLSTFQVTTSNPFNLSTQPGGDNIFVFRDRAVAQDEFGSSIGFSCGPDTGPDIRRAAIATVRGADTDQAGLAFFVHSSTTDTDDIEEKMRISADGNIGIGTTAPDSILHVTGNTGIVFKVEGSDTTTHNFVVLADGKVGIGKLNPNNKLDIYGNLAVGENYTGMTAPDNSLIVEGKIGAGVSQPTTGLQVGYSDFTGRYGSFSDDTAALLVAGTSVQNSIQISSTYNDPVYPNYGLVMVNGASTSEFDVWSVSHDGPAITTGGLHFKYLNGTGQGADVNKQPSLMFLGKGGNIGIATTYPTEKLEVIGNINAAVTDNITGPSIYITKDETDNNADELDQLGSLVFRGKRTSGYKSGAMIRAVVDQSTVQDASELPSALLFYTAEDNGTNINERMRIESSGEVGIGTSDPDALLHISSNAGIIFRAQGTDADNNNLVLLYDGKVGIGRTDPVQKVDIESGNIEMDEDYGLGHNVDNATTEQIFYPSRAGIQSMAGLGSDSPFDKGMSFESDELIALVETDSNELKGWFDFENNDFVWNGKVGIASSDPVYDLDVNGTIRASDTIFGHQVLDRKTGLINGLGPWIRFAETDQDADAYGLFEIRWDKLGKSGYILMNAGVHNNEGDKISMNLIGSSAKNVEAIDKVRLLESSSGQKMYLELNAADASNLNVEIHYYTGDGWKLIDYEDGNSSNFVIHEQTITSAFAVNEDSKTFVVKKDGNVGVATTDPKEKLEVAGAIKIGGSFENTLPGRIRYDSANGGEFKGVREDLSEVNFNSMWLRDDIGPETGIYYLAGNTGVGTSDPERLLHVVAGGSNILVVDDDHKQVGIMSDTADVPGAWALYVKGSGHFTENLAVSSNLYVENNIDADSYTQNGVDTLSININGNSQSSNSLLSSSLEEYTLTDLIRRQRSKYMISGGGLIQWGIAANTFSFNRNLFVIPAGKANTFFNITPESLTDISAWSVIYIRPSKGNWDSGSSVDISLSKEHYSTYEPGPDDIIIAVRNGDDNCLYMADGRIIEYGYTRDTVNGTMTVSGNIGIATTQPLAPLHIRADGDNNPETNSLYVYNSDNSGDNDDSFITAMVGGANAGDPQISLGIKNVTGWIIGVDNSNEDKFKISKDIEELHVNTMLAIRSDNGYVGIGEVTPNQMLHVAGQVEIEGSALIIGTDDSVSKGSNTNQRALLHSSTPADSLHLNYTGDFEGGIVMGTNRMYVRESDGYVGINEMSPAYHLDVNGDIQCTQLHSDSDLRYKKDIKNIENVLEKILALRGISYVWRTDRFPEKQFPKGRSIGVVAQELEQYFPELVSTDVNGYKSVNYQNMVVVLLEALKEQNKKIESQEERLDKLINDNIVLKSDVEEIKKIIKLMEKDK